MALEALFSDKQVYGKRAIKSRLLPLIDGADLYAVYRSEFQSLHPLLVDKTLIEDVVSLRNEIAHGGGVPQAWLKTPSRNAVNKSYLDDLTDAGTALVRLVWLHILDNSLQSLFSDKIKMASYCASGAKIQT